MMVGDIAAGGLAAPMLAPAAPAAAGFADILGLALPLAGAETDAARDSTGGHGASNVIAPVAVLRPSLSSVVAIGADPEIAVDQPAPDQAGQPHLAVSSRAEVVVAMPAGDTDASPPEAAIAAGSESPEAMSPETDETESMEAVVLPPAQPPPPPAPGLVSWILAGMPPVGAQDDAGRPGPPPRPDAPAGPVTIPVDNACVRSEVAGATPLPFPGAAVTAAGPYRAEAATADPSNGLAPPQALPSTSAAQVAPPPAGPSATVAPGGVAAPSGGKLAPGAATRGDADGNPGKAPLSPQRVREEGSAGSIPAAPMSSLRDAIALAGSESAALPMASDFGSMPSRPAFEPVRGGDTRPLPPAAAPAPAAELKVESARLGEVGIALEGSTRDLRVLLSVGGAAGGATVLAEAPRLAAELATQGVRLQGLSVADGSGATAGQWQPPSPGGGDSNRQRPSPEAVAPAALPGLAVEPIVSAAHRWGKGDRYA